MLGLFNNLFSPNDSTGTSTALGTPTSTGGGGKTFGQGKVGGVEDTIEFLNQEDESPDKKDVIDLTPKKTKEPVPEEQEETPEEESEETDELDEIEQELEGPPEDKLELVTPVRRKEILAKYPNLFKDFPQLENSYYRDQQFTEMFGTVKDAQAVAEKAETLDKFEGEILDGNIRNVLKAVKEESPNSFLKVVDDWMTTLADVDERAYMHVLGNITKHTIIAMVREGRRSGNEALQNAAQLVNQFVFGSSDFVQPTQLSKNNTQQNDQDNAQTEREQTFLRNQFNTTKEDLDSRVNNTLRNTIEANIDPRKSMSDYVRKNASREALENLAGLMERDTRFKSLADKLWENVFKTNFSKDSVERVRSAYLSKAKTLLPAVIKKARNDALRGTGHRVREEEQEESTTNRGPIATGEPRTRRTGKIKEGKDIPKGMSTLDFLNSD